MKIAVYLSGQSRMLGPDGHWPSLLELFEGHEVDFYFHFWENEEYTQDHILNIFNPVDYKIEPQIDFTSQAEYIFNNLTGKRLQTPQLYCSMMSFYYSFAQARSLIPLEQYDYICKTRTDIKFKGNLNNVIKKVDDSVTIQTTAKHPKVRLTDFVFISTPQIFSTILDVAELALTPDKYLKEYERKRKNFKFTSHTYLGYAFEKFKIKHAPLYLIEKLK